VWIGYTPSAGSGLTEWDPDGGLRFHSVGDGIPRSWPTAFGEDRYGGVWVGFYEGGVARYWKGHFRTWRDVDGVPGGSIRAIYRDRSDRLWIAGDSGGVALVSQEDREPQFSRWTKADGLSSNNARAIAEDQWGRLYVGTEHGVDRLDVEARRVRHYTTADGLASNQIEVALADHDGTIWFGTFHGLSRLTPTHDSPGAPPPVWITAIRAGGTPWPLGALGASTVDLPAFGSSANHVEITFGGLDFAARGDIRYEYWLEGIDSAWQAPTDLRSVHYAGLAPGTYRFQVRALDVDGRVSPTPASVAFMVLAPVWQRRWFLALAAALLAGAAYGAHRVRLTRRLAVERVRMRIASDLHDDVGSTVSRMAILSEVAKRQIEGTHATTARVLEEIGASARELLDTTGDIVWAIDPRRDEVASLVARVREFGSALLEARGIAWDFQVSPEAEGRAFDPEQRRQLLLIFKEALHNIVRHAHCTEVSVTIAAPEGRLHAEIRDNGRGFVDTSDTGSGHGLASMRARAEQLGGALRIHSDTGTGTRLTLDVPLDRRSA